MLGGWLLIDMPGLRELQLWADPERIGAELAKQRRFRYCRQIEQKKCGQAEVRA